MDKVIFTKRTFSRITCRLFVVVMQTGYQSPIYLCFYYFTLSYCLTYSISIDSCYHRFLCLCQFGPMTQEVSSKHFSKVSILHFFDICSSWGQRINVMKKKSTLVISKSKSEILQDICTSTYKICKIEEKINRTTTFYK